MNIKNAFYNYVCLFTSIFCFIAMFIFGDTIKETVRAALRICSVTIIPSLFPFIVCSRLLVHFYSRMRIKKDSHVFSLTGLSAPGTAVFILGLVSGFPAGAVIAGKMYDSGILTKCEAEKIAVYASVASPSFCIVYFGSEIMKNILYGIIVYAAIVCVSVLLLFIDNSINRKCKEGHDYTVDKSQTAETDFIPDIICDSCITVINVCAFITFFMCIGKIITKILCFFFPGASSLNPLITGILEFSGGISALGTESFGRRIMLGALLLGFCGVSAIMQVLNVFAHYDFSASKLIIFKIVSAFLVPSVFFILFLIYDALCKTSVNIRILFFIIPLIAAFLIFIIEKCRKNIRKAKIISKI